MPHEKASEEPVRYRPRFTYQGRLILARRQWRIFPDSFPKRRVKEKDAQYFLRLQHWRDELGLPEEVFMRVRILPTIPPAAESPEAEDTTVREDQAPEDVEKPNNEATEETTDGTDEAADPSATPKRPQLQRRVRQHHHKPQYIDFRNPLLVDLFSRVTENLQNFVVTLEERLPAAEHLVHASGAEGEDHFTTELVLQVDFPELKEPELKEGTVGT